MDRVISGTGNFCVCVCVSTLKGKWLELSTPNLVHIYYMAVAWHAVTHMSKGQWLRSHGYETIKVVWLLVKCAATASVGLHII